MYPLYWGRPTIIGFLFSYQWAKAWQLSISVKKCCVTQVGSIQRTRDRSSHQFVLCNSVLQYVDVVNDLGVVVDQHLTFSEHIDQVVQKAASRCYLLLKCFQSRNCSRRYEGAGSRARSMSDVPQARIDGGTIVQLPRSSHQTHSAPADYGTCTDAGL